MADQLRSSSPPDAGPLVILRMKGETTDGPSRPVVASFEMSGEEAVRLISSLSRSACTDGEAVDLPMLREVVRAVLSECWAGSGGQPWTVADLARCVVEAATGFVREKSFDPEWN